MKKTILILLLLILSLIVTFFLVARYAARSFAFPQTRTEEEAIAISIEEYHDFEKSWFDSLDFLPFSVTSNFGYDLKGVYLKGDSQNTIVLCHGHGDTWQGMVKYMPLLIEQGWNIIAYNHRFHGTSGGDFCSAGYYEAKDLSHICDKAFELFPETETFALLGESMGAATVLQYIPNDNRLDFVWVDSPYSDLRDLYVHQLSESYNLPPFIYQPILLFIDIYFKRVCNFELKDVSPQKEIVKSSVPIIFFHGTEDSYVPTWMSQEMYELRQEFALTQLILTEGAGHTKSINVDRENYEKKLNEFLQAYVGFE